MTILNDQRPLQNHAMQDDNVQINGASKRSKRADRDWAKTIDTAGNLTLVQRYVQVWGFEVQDRLFKLARRFGAPDRARREPLKSDHPRLTKFRKQAYGTPGKPAKLEEIPWDYVREHEAEIPFLGLREYWYPAVLSKELVHNEPTPITLCGEALVFFRDADSKACALEDRCPHRSPLLSIGQMGVVEPGTITCRYHGATFDGDGNCIAFIADGADSPACKSLKARSYPVEELGGIVFVYMGHNEPKSVRETIAYADDVFSHELVVTNRTALPFNHLNLMDNSADVAHVGVLHRTCVLFAGQKVAGQISVETTENGGVLTKFADDVAQPGAMSIDKTEWHLPNFIFHAPGDLTGIGYGYAWVVPNDIGNSTFWTILAVTAESKLKQAAISRALPLLSSDLFDLGPTVMGCLDGGDLPMMASQGRIPRWDMDKLASIDRGITTIRRKLKTAHKAERAERKAAGLSETRVAPPLP